MNSFLKAGTEQVANVYRNQGFVHVPGVFSMDEIKAMLVDGDALLQRSDLLHQENLRCRWQVHSETGAEILDAFDPITDLSQAANALARHPRLLALLESLLGEPCYLFKDKLIYKPPGSIGYALHQDYISWPKFPRSFTTALVALDASTRENGCLELYEGYHDKGYLSPADGDFHDLPPSLFDAARRVSYALAPGDILIFGAFVPHGSGPNRTNDPRRHLYLSYNARSDGGDLRESHYQEFHSWLKRRYAEYGYVRSFFR